MPLLLCIRSPRAMIEVIVEAPSPNFDARNGAAGHPGAALHRHADRPGGARAPARSQRAAGELALHEQWKRTAASSAPGAPRRRARLACAGVSYWKGERNINGVSIGVEIVNPGHEFGYRPFPDAQIAAVVALCADIRSRVDDRRRPHRRPLRRGFAGAARTIPASCSPGSGWPRRAMACNGSRRRPRPARCAWRLGVEGVEVFALQAGFTRLGYDLPPSGKFDEATQQVVTAFQRHWRKDKVDGIADGETRAQLDRAACGLAAG